MESAGQDHCWLAALALIGTRRGGALRCATPFFFFFTMWPSEIKASGRYRRVEEEYMQREDDVAIAAAETPRVPLSLLLGGRRRRRTAWFNDSEHVDGERTSPTSPRSACGAAGPRRRRGHWRL